LANSGKLLGQGSQHDQFYKAPSIGRATK
jgi:hypothetical protein